jgi:hypothetical protein
MATYVNDLRLKEIATGDESGTWGTSTNTNLELIAEAFSYGTEVITTNADTHTTTIADGATDPGRSLYLKYTGTLDSACTITIGPNTVSKVWIIENGTSGSQDIILSQGSGANITIPAGDTKVVYSDGAGAGAAFFDAFASLSVVDLKVQDDLTVTGDIDVDGTTNLDVVDIDGAVDMASTLQVDGAATFTTEIQASGGIAVVEATPSMHFESTTTSISAGNSFGDLTWYSNDASSASTGILAKINAVANRNFDGDQSATGMDLTFSTVNLTGKNSPVERLRIDYAGNTVFNDTGADADFRVESDNDTHALFVQGSDGNVGIGTSSPAAKLHIESAATNEAIRINTSTGYNAGINYYVNDTIKWTAQVLGDGTDAYRFYNFVAASEAMRINSSGNVRINNTDAGNYRLKIAYLGSGEEAIGLQTTYAGTSNMIRFINSSATTVGIISSTTSATTYATSSDYRLKEDDVPMTGATERVKALRPINFAWKVDGSRVDGFLAHEAAEVVPECVTGTKDAMRDEEYEVTPAVYKDVITPAVEAVDAVLDADGLVITEAVEAVAETTESVLVTEAVMGTRSVPDYQGIDQSKLVPLLTAALQEAITKIEDLTTRLETLENA